MSFDDDESINDHLQDDIVKEALESGQDLRDYSKKIESELVECEQVSIQAGHTCNIIAVYYCSFLNEISSNALLKQFGFGLNLRVSIFLPSPSN